MGWAMMKIEWLVRGWLVVLGVAVVLMVKVLFQN